MKSISFFTFMAVAVFLVLAVCGRCEYVPTEVMFNTEKRVFKTADDKMAVFLLGDIIPRSPTYPNQVLYVKDLETGRVSYLASAKELHDKSRCPACGESKDDGVLSIRDVVLSRRGNKIAVITRCYNVTFDGDTEFEAEANFLSIMNSDGSNRIIIAEEEEVKFPEWSNDEKKLVYVYRKTHWPEGAKSVRDRSSESGIRVVDAITGAVKTLDIKIIGYEREFGRIWCGDEKVPYKIMTSTYGEVAIE